MRIREEEVVELGDEEESRDSPSNGDVWEVVGGGMQGGVVVRLAKDLLSPKAPLRLSTGALIRELRHDDRVGRLRYERLTGTGPLTGWVSTSFQGKSLLVKTSKKPSNQNQELAVPTPQDRASLQSKVMPLAEAPQHQQQGQKVSHTPRSEYLNDMEVFIQKPVVRKVTSVGFSMAKPLEEAVENGLFEDPYLLSSEEPLFGKYLSGSGKGLAKKQSLGLQTAPFVPPESWPKSGHGAALDIATTRVSLAQEPLSGRPAPRGSSKWLMDALRSKSRGVMSSFGGVPLSQAPEDQTLCTHCRLPIGDWGYAHGNGGAVLHGECQAQQMLKDASEKQQARQEAEATLKAQKRAQYGIGWKPERLPRSLALAREWGCQPMPQHMCCLEMDVSSRTVRIAPTTDPATAVNLEYLSLALQVRLREGREPLFSLDPQAGSLDPASGTRESMQVKRFEPEWLADTSVGEVMFQADYHLKELSMGEQEQPVVGLKSCLDLDLSGETAQDKEWRAREWFVVEKADIFLSEGNVLTPYVKMGVEAREQFLGPTCLEDKKITRPDHPLVKYAEAFTHYFDLIAERKSSIYHLRELAKASVLAKFLVEEGFDLDASWFDVAGKVEGGLGPTAIPQLWTERCLGQIQVKDGRIVQTSNGVRTSKHEVYGGVEFGLGALPRVALTSVSSNYATDEGMLAAAMDLAEAELFRPETIAARERMPTAALSFAPAARLSIGGVRAGAPVALSMSQPLGVDLNLAGFDLSGPVKAKQQPEGDSRWESEHLALCGNAFWSRVDAGDAKDVGLYRALFNPFLSDRRSEGELFLPPSSSFRYLDRLVVLLAEEEEVRRQRQEHFLSEAFSKSEPGPLFPATWAPPLGIKREAARPSRDSPPRSAWQPSKSEVGQLERALVDATPVFDKSTEDGLRFRIYDMTGADAGADIEVRTVQEPGGREIVGAVFSSPLQPNAKAMSAHPAVREGEYVVKVTEYVEVASEGATRLPWHFYEVLETENGNMVMTEKLQDGREVWTENPQGLDARCARAKVAGCADCRGAGVTLRDARKVATRSES
jgi:hypothetical protein